MYFIILTILYLLCFVILIVKSNEQEDNFKITKKKKWSKCDLFLAPLKTRPTDGFRTGVYAGRKFREGELIEIANSVVMKRDVIEEWQLYDYSFETESKDHEMHLFGTAMILPHHEDGNIHHFWTVDSDEEDFKMSPPNPYSEFPTVAFYTQSPISRGEELMLSVEGSEGDVENDTDGKEFTPYTVDELNRKGHCLTNVYAAESEISQAGQGLFTKKFVKKGDIVTISPLMVLPRHKVEKQNPISLLINYCISQNDSDVALLPVGLAGMINHNNRINGDAANLRMEWHSWDSPGGRAKTRWHPNELESAPFPPLYMKYIAERDIYAQEELTISYGDDWEEQWKAHEALSRSAECDAEDGSESDEAVLPQFRHYISAPDGLFPANFVSTCIGKNKNDCGILEAQRKMMFDEELKMKFEKGPELAAAYRDKIHSRTPNPDDEPKTCQRIKKEEPLVFSELNPPVRES